MKTTRTGFNDERPRVRQAYAEARSEGKGHEEARSAAAKGLPLHLVDDWTADLKATFDGSDVEAQNMAVVSTVLRNGGKIRRRFSEPFAETDPENWPDGRPTFGRGR